MPRQRIGVSPIDDLTDSVARTAGLSPGQAHLAVEGMLRFLASRLPSPLFGELQMRLQVDGDAPASAPFPASSPPPAGPAA